MTLLAGALAICGCGGGHAKSAGALPVVHQLPPLTQPAAPSGAESPAGTTRTRAGQRPNVVFILTDDLAWNLVRFMPHVRRMRQQGLTFTNYFVTDSLCCPSRASIFTGRLPHDTRVFTNNPPAGGFRVFYARAEEGQTFAFALQRSGYLTALMGKYLNGYQPSDTQVGATRAYVPPGWNEWDVAGNGYPEFGYDLNQNGAVVPYGYRPQDYLTDVLARKGVRFIDRAAARHRPFLLELATFAPHAPFIPAPRDAGDFPGLRAPRDPAFNAKNTAAPAWLSRLAPLTPVEIRRIDLAFRLRAQSVQAIDRMIGRLESALRRRGLARRTYLVFSSDNGLHMGEHRMLPGKLTAFDTDIRVPLVVVGPSVPRGATVSKLAQNTDLTPTFLSLAGLRVPLGIEGRSLVPFLRGRTPHSWRRAVLVEHRGPQVTPGDPDLPVRGAGNPGGYEAIRTPTSLYVEYFDGEREYYDLRRDPWELHNLAAAFVSSPRALSVHRTLVGLESCHSGPACWQAAGGRG